MANVNATDKPLVSVSFDFEKETKGAVRYQERGHAPMIGTLYLRKAVFATPEYPKVLDIIVKVGK
jgi:hypothetical protein